MSMEESLYFEETPPLIKENKNRVIDVHRIARASPQKINPTKEIANKKSSPIPLLGLEQFPSFFSSCFSSFRILLFLSIHGVVCLFLEVVNIGGKEEELDEDREELESNVGCEKREEWLERMLNDSADNNDFDFFLLEVLNILWNFEELLRASFPDPLFRFFLDCNYTNKLLELGENRYKLFPIIDKNNLKCSN